MDLAREISGELSKYAAKRIVNLIGPDQERFNTLATLMLGDDEFLANRAAFYVRHCVDAHPFLLDPVINALIIKLNRSATDPVKRCITGLLQKASIPEQHEGFIAEKCFEYLNSTGETIAVKVYSMSILYKFVKKYPALKLELEIAIRDQLPYGSAGFRNRGKKILAALKNIQVV